MFARTFKSRFMGHEHILHFLSWPTRFSLPVQGTKIFQKARFQISAWHWISSTESGVFRAIGLGNNTEFLDFDR